MDVLFAAYGGSIKANDEGILEGRGIVFGSPDSPDRSSYKDYFDSNTQVNPNNTFETWVTYEHGDGYRGFIGKAILSKVDTGWDVVAQLDMDNPFVKEKYSEIKSGGYGFSTGAVAHVVDRAKQSNGTHQIKQWSVGEIAVTKRPAEQKAIIREIKYVPLTEEEKPTMEKLFEGLVKSLSEKREVTLSEETIKSIVENISVKTDVKSDSELQTKLDEMETKLADFEAKFKASEEALEVAQKSLEEFELIKSELEEKKSELTRAEEKNAQLSLLADVEKTLKGIK